MGSGSLPKMEEFSLAKLIVFIHSKKGKVMKNKTIALVMTAAMAATVLAGCGGGSSSSTAPTTSSKAPATSSTAPATSSTTPASTTTEATKVNLTVWSPQEDQSDSNWLGKVCDAFNAAHPEWDITFKYGVCSEGDAKTNLTNDPAAGADVYMYANDQIPDLVTAGAVAELGGSTVEAIKANNSETTVATVTYEDAIYGVPFTGNTWFMYYNKDIFTEDDVKSLDTMLEKGKVSFPLNNSWYFASFYAANGCTLFGADGTDKAAGIQLGGEAGAAVTKYLVNLVKNKNFANDANGSGLSGFGDGSIGAFFSGTWDYNNALEALGGDESKLGVCAAPTVKIDGKDCQMKAFAGSKAIGVNPHSANPQVAVALAAYMGSTEAQKLHFELRNIIPTDNGVDVGDNALAKAQMDAMSYASIVQPVLPEMSRYWDPAVAMANELIDKKVTEDNAAEKTDAMSKSMNESVIE